VLCADGMPLDNIAAQLGTPAYVYSAAAIDASFNAIDAALAGTPHLVAYATKANGNLAILSRLARASAGADIVSGGELARALKAGFPPERIVFSGVGKSDAEIEAALQAGVRSIHAESEQEIDAIEAVAGRLGTRARIALRVNPDVDAGGGWPITYGDEDGEAAAHARFGHAIIDAVKRGAGDLGLTIVVEPGRSIVGDSCVLLTRVLYVKEQSGKRFVIVDAAMTELIRPALYGAYHAVVPVSEPSKSAPRSPADVVGPVCESGDFLAQDRMLPPLQRGDLLAIRGAGAYGAAMASNYNSRPFAPEGLVDRGQLRLIRARQPIEALWQNELVD